MSAGTRIELDTAFNAILLRLHSLRVPGLKAVARAISVAQHGRKADIQDRVKRYLQIGRDSEDIIRLRVLQQLVDKAYNGETSLPTYESLYRHYHLNSLNGEQQADAPAASGAFSSQSHSSLPSTQKKPWLFFKENPSFVLKKMMTQSAGICHKSPNNRAKCSLEFVLSENDYSLLQTNKNYKLYLLCGQYDRHKPPTDAVIEFPHPLEIHFNSVQLKDNVKGLKNKPGTAKPANLTPYVNLPGRVNRLDIIYAFSKSDYLAFCYLIERVPPEKLLQKILTNPHIAKKSTIEEIVRGNDDDDIQEMSTRLSLKCPLSFTRLKYPVKSIHCKHLPCFDALSFLYLQEQASTWSCPICEQPIKIKELAISDYVYEILQTTDLKVETVEIETNGVWKPIIEDDDDEDFDDDQDDENNNAQNKNGQKIKNMNSPIRKSELPIVISLDSDDEDAEISNSNSPQRAAPFLNDPQRQNNVNKEIRGHSSPANLSNNFGPQSFEEAVDAMISPGPHPPSRSQIQHQSLAHQPEQLQLQRQSQHISDSDSISSRSSKLQAPPLRYQLPQILRPPQTSPEQNANLSLPPPLPTSNTQFSGSSENRTVPESQHFSQNSSPQVGHPQTLYSTHNGEMISFSSHQANNGTVLNPVLTQSQPANAAQSEAFYQGNLVQSRPNPTQLQQPNTESNGLLDSIESLSSNINNTTGNSVAELDQIKDLLNNYESLNNSVTFQQREPPPPLPVEQQHFSNGNGQKQINDTVPSSTQRALLNTGEITTDQQLPGMATDGEQTVETTISHSHEAPLQKEVPVAPAHQRFDKLRSISDTSNSTSLSLQTVPNPPVDQSGNLPAIGFFTTSGNNNRSDSSGSNNGSVHSPQMEGFFTDTSSRSQSAPARTPTGSQLPKLQLAQQVNGKNLRNTVSIASEIYLPEPLELARRRVVSDKQTNEQTELQHKLDQHQQRATLSKSNSERISNTPNNAALVQMQSLRDSINNRNATPNISTSIPFASQPNEATADSSDLAQTSTTGEPITAKEVSNVPSSTSTISYNLAKPTPRNYSPSRFSPPKNTGLLGISNESKGLSRPPNVFVPSRRAMLNKRASSSSSQQQPQKRQQTDLYETELEPESTLSQHTQSTMNNDSDVS